MKYDQWSWHGRPITVCRPTPQPGIAQRLDTIEQRLDEIIALQKKIQVPTSPLGEAPVPAFFATTF